MKVVFATFLRNEINSNKVDWVACDTQALFNTMVVDINMSAL